MSSETSPLVVTSSPLVVNSPSKGPEGEEELVIHEVSHSHKASALASFFTVTLGFVGLGLLSLPYGMQFVGLVGGPLIILFVAAVTLYCFKIVIDTKNLYLSRGMKAHTYAEIGGAAFGNLGSVLVDVGILATQLGSVASYQQFVGKNLQHLTLQSYYIMPLSGWVMLWNFVLVGLVWVRKLKYFAFTSVLGLLTVVFAVFSVVYYGATHATPIDPIPLGPSDLFLFLGIAAFSYGAIPLSISVENNMREPKKFMKVISATFLTISLIYIGFGGVAFYLYGNNIQAVVSCVVQGPLGIALKGAMILQLTCSIPLNAVPIWGTIEPWIHRKIGHLDVRAQFWIINAWRFGLISVTGVIAFALPYFGDFANLVGAIAVSSVTWILPPCLHLKAFGPKLSLPVYLFDVAIMVLGFGIMLSSSAITVISLVAKISSTAPVNPLLC